MVTACLISAAMVRPAPAVNMVPCVPVASSTTGPTLCPSPIIQGVIKGQWIGLVTVGGGTAGTESAYAFMATIAGGFPYDFYLGKINAIATSDATNYSNAGGPDGLTFRFTHGKLWAVNKISHTQWTRFVVREFNLRWGPVGGSPYAPELVVEKTARFDCGSCAKNPSDPTLWTKAGEALSLLQP